MKNTMGVMMMPVSNEDELRDQIENLEDGYEDIKYNHKQEIKGLIVEFLEDMNYLGGSHWKRIHDKWEGKLYEGKD